MKPARNPSRLAGFLWRFFAPYAGRMMDQHAVMTIRMLEEQGRIPRMEYPPYRPTLRVVPKGDQHE